MRNYFVLFISALVVVASLYFSQYPMTTLWSGQTESIQINQSPVEVAAPEKVEIAPGECEDEFVSKAERCKALEREILKVELELEDMKLLWLTLLGEVEAMNSRKRELGDRELRADGLILSDLRHKVKGESYQLAERALREQEERTVKRLKERHDSNIGGNLGLLDDLALDRKELEMSLLRMQLEQIECFSGE